MHNAQGYANSILQSNQNLSKQSPTLSLGQSQKLKKALQDDALGAIYSGITSIADATQAINNGFYSWATIKLYYSVFYFARSIIALETDTAILYSGTHPCSWQCKPGLSPIARKGTTHKVVLNMFTTLLPNHFLLSQQIDMKTPFDWMKNLREEINYRTPKFQEPDVPEHFKFIAKYSTRKTLSAYASDDQHLYTFDKDHAILAFPLSTLKSTFNSLSNAKLEIDKDDVNYLISTFSDKHGPIPEIASLLRKRK